MRRLVLAAALAALSVCPSFAKNLAVPADDPAITVAVPNSWTLKEIDFGYSAVSPDKEVAFYVEYASGKRVKAMTDLNKEWMKDNSIKATAAPEEIEADFNGLKGSIVKYKATDENGPTNVNFAFLPAGADRVVMMTLWASDEEQAKHSKEIDAILDSIKPIR